jgi:hypothetical protein
VCLRSDIGLPHTTNFQTPASVSTEHPFSLARAAPPTPPSWVLTERLVDAAVLPMVRRGLVPDLDDIERLAHDETGSACSQRVRQCVRCNAEEVFTRWA